MPKLKLLILDAGVVIYLHEIGLWHQVMANCDLYLSRIVAEKEVLFQKSERDEYGYDIDLSPLIKSGAITVFDVSVSDLKTFRNQFDLLYLGPRRRRIRVAGLSGEAVARIPDFVRRRNRVPRAGKPEPW